MTKRQLANQLPKVPLGVQSNRLQIALVLTGKRMNQLAKKTGIDNTILSNIANGHREPTEAQREAIARYFGVDENAMFPKPVAA